MLIGNGASINPATGAEEFGFRDWLKDRFGSTAAEVSRPVGGMSNFMPGEWENSRSRTIGQVIGANIGELLGDIFRPRSARTTLAGDEKTSPAVEIEPIYIKGTRRMETLSRVPAQEGWVMGTGIDFKNTPGVESPKKLKVPVWVSARTTSLEGKPTSSSTGQVNVPDWIRKRIPDLQFPTRVDRPLPTGGFDSRRSGGARKHSAYDFETRLADDVYSGSSGVVTQIGNVYDPRKFPDDPNAAAVAGMYKYVDVTTPSGHVVRHSYVLPNVKEGDEVEGGKSVLGMAQNIDLMYGDEKRDKRGKITDFDSGTRNHVHMEVYDRNRDALGLPNAWSGGRFDIPARQGSFRLNFLNSMQRPERFGSSDRNVTVNVGPLTTSFSTPRVRR
ncbi:MAG: hypothetical protein SFV19_06630 [Rhodospirillaceae bacterium]|nr:hypothetical protein [Rhodospirillaceae bacterium]